MKEKVFASKVLKVDECDICMVQSKCPQILASKRKCQIAFLTSSERESLMTVGMYSVYPHTHLTRCTL